MLSPTLVVCWLLLPGFAAEPPARVEGTMVAWAAEQAPAELPPAVRLRKLHAALTAPEGLALADEVGFTATAREAFARKRANCVAFALLFVGLARALGLDVDYALDGEIRKVERHGTFRVLHGHLAARWGEGRDALLIDAAGFYRPRGEGFEPIDDTTVAAIFYSNRGSESLLAGDLALARALLEQALIWDPALEPARRNLDVVRRRERAVGVGQEAAWSASAGLAADGGH